ncbi:MAG TPA: antibiotic biosynthesis monooxygenase [Lysobacter sp.]|jgi:quinol monooxygenase YgiN|nr:antibiotic biosynthesis monooxygenase [Lysobacter sp.]
MISIVAKWSILPGKEVAAIAALQDLARRVQELEPFVPMYTIHIPDFSVASYPTPSTQDVVFFSVFDNREAFEKHLHGPVFQDWLAQHPGLFLFNNSNLFVVSELLHRVAGFVRPGMVTANANASTRMASA